MNIYGLLEKYQLNSKGFLNINDLGNVLKFADQNSTNT
jgi:Ca2+-binding EF-hand superfamily protein